MSLIARTFKCIFKTPFWCQEAKGVLWEYVLALYSIKWLDLMFSISRFRRVIVKKILLNFQCASIDMQLLNKTLLINREYLPNSYMYFVYYNTSTIMEGASIIL